jgi:Ran GTPase-activating protein (RanGAP) involved in mRNA processing and transport
VARKSDEIPQSIRSISLSLKGINLKRIDFSNNAVNLHGAKQFLEYLEQASTLEVLLIANCGLGPLGAAEIAQGFKGTPNLRIFSIARNRLTDDGINHISNVLHHVPKLEELFIYQNTLKE